MSSKLSLVLVGAAILWPFMASSLYRAYDEVTGYYTNIYRQQQYKAQFEKEIEENCLKGTALYPEMCAARGLQNKDFGQRLLDENCPKNPKYDFRCPGYGGPPPDAYMSK